MEEKIKEKMEEEKNKALDALGRYKFWMFGYHAANWVNLNKILSKKQPNPFKDLVQIAKERFKNTK